MDKVTVIIPSYRRPDKLRETIDALRQQDTFPGRLIVVDDGSDDGSADEKEKMMKDLPFPAKLIRQPNSGAAAAMNKGAEAAEDGLLIFFDDDIIPEKNVVQMHMEHQQKFPGSILCGSADTDPGKAKNDLDRYKLEMEKQWIAARPDTLDKIKVDFSNFITTTANMSMPKSVFISSGEMNTDFRDGYDMEFGLRALQKNVPVYFDRHVKAIHNDIFTLRHYGSRQKAYIDSKEKMLRDFPELKKLVGDRYDIHISAFKKMIYSILRRKRITNFVERSKFMMLLPRKFRYRIYGSTIAAISTSK